MISSKRFQQDFKLYLPGIILAAISLILIAISSILLTKSINNSELVKSTNTGLSTLSSRLTTLKVYASNQNELRADNLLFDSVLTSDPSVPVVVTQVQQLAIDSSVSLSALQFSPGAPTGSGAASSNNVIGMQLSVSGSYNNVSAFLRNVENCGRLINVKSLRLSTSNVGLTAGQTDITQAVTATLTLESPYYVKSSKAETATVDLKNPEFIKMVTLLRTFKIYAPRVDNSGIGKSNPFQ
ncbi:MAG: type 4a pilus biogenesis protein PilO [candidate division WWE3 bacterium]|nr:type 4a pilus biogenesis protein PilO [candidate division WWE3 bacterium]